MTFPVLPKSKYLVKFQAPFKDGNLAPLLRDAGFPFFESQPSTVLNDATGWMSERLFEMCTNSGAVLEVMDKRLDIPKSNRAPEPQPEPQPESEKEFLEPLTLDDLSFSGPAKALAREKDVLAAELIETLSEWEISSGAWAEHKFSKAEVQAVIDQMEG